MPHPSSRMLRQLPRLLLTPLFALVCGTLFAFPLSAAPARPAPVQARIDQQLAVQRALRSNPLALRRALPHSRAAQFDLARAGAAGRSPAVRGMRPGGPGRNAVQGGGPATALYVAFDDDRAIGESYLAKFDAAGLPASGWPAFGLPVIAGAQLAFETRSVDDGVGGRVVGWAEYGIGVARLHAQRINDTGARQWGSTGVTVSPNFDLDFAWEMIPDGAGGAFFAWEATSAGSPTIHAQHLNGAGAVAAGWPDSGVVLGAAGTTASAPQLARDGVGGVYVTWSDLSTGMTYAQYLDASAAPQFSPAEGRPFSFVMPGFSISPDAGSGLTLAWALNTGVGDDILAERLDTDGTPTWGDSGIVVCADPAEQNQPQIQPDGSGGLLIGWLDEREGLGAVYAQRLDSGGAPVSGWPADGARVAGATYLVGFGWIPDGLGGAFFATVADLGLGQGRVALQHLLSDGTIANNYGADGQEVATQANSAPITMALDGGGGVLAAWLEYDDVFSQTVALFGQRIDIGGALAWGGGNPLRLSPSATGRQGRPSLVEGGSGGARVGFEQYNGSAAGLDAGFKRVNQAGAPQGSTIPVAYGPNSAAYLNLVPDAPNRLLAVWFDEMSTSSLFVQRFSSQGAPLWPTDVEVTSNSYVVFGADKVPAVSDGASGAIMAWSGYDVTAQRVDSSGALRWGPTGTQVFTATNGSFLFSEQSIQPAEANGAFVTGTVFDNVSRWCVQKLDGDGNRLWGTNGYELVNDSLGIFTIFNSEIVPDGQGGVYAAWQIGLFPDDPVRSIRMVRILSTGLLAPGWPVEGVPVRNAFESALLTGLAPDGLGNAVATWMEFRGGRTGSYAQLVNASGALQWNGPEPNDAINGTVNQGVALALNSGAQLLPLVETDDAGGAVFTWLDGRGSSWDVYAQRITSDGARAWSSDGVGVCTAAGPQGDLALVSDGASGALIAWADGRTMPADQVMIARVLANGTLPWSSNGVVSTLASLHSATVVDGVARLEWTTSAATFRARLERRTASEGWSPLGDVVADGTGWIRAEDATVERGMRYGYRLVARIDGAEQPLGEVWLDVPSSLAFALKGVRPNPANGPLTVAFTLPKSAPARIEVLDIAGRRVLSRDVGALGAGSHVLNLGEPRGLGSGLYFLRLTQGSDRREVRFTRVR